MKKTLAILPGDGIGPEIMESALKVLKLVEQKWGHEFILKKGLIGGAAYEKHQVHFPDETLEICKEADAILFGSVGGPVGELDQPKWIDCEKNALLGLRKAFQLSQNVRPVRVYAELSHLCPLKKERLGNGLDMVFIRELVGGIYFGEHKTETIHGQKKARDVMEYTEDQIRTVAHKAFTTAQKRRKKVSSIDKSNVLDCSRLWREVVIQVSKEYPDVELEHLLVDNCAMQIIKNPQSFDVLLTPNMFGDILSDAAAVLPGSLGLMPSASFNADGFGLYEPAGGSAPDIAGKNVANPIAQIMCVSLLLRHSCGLEEEASAVDQAIESVLKKGFGTADICTSDQVALKTSELTQKICQELA